MYVREVLENWRDPKTKKVSLCWGSQTAKTTSIYVGLGFVIDQSPGPILWVWSNEKQARNFSNDRLLPFCEDSPALAKHLPKTLDGKIDRDRATALRIEFDLHIFTGGPHIRMNSPLGARMQRSTHATSKSPKRVASVLEQRQKDTKCLDDLTKCHDRVKDALEEPLLSTLSAGHGNLRNHVALEPFKDAAAQLKLILKISSEAFKDI